MATINVAVSPTGHWYTDEKEEVYFSVLVTAPRVGEVTLRFHAHRYVALGNAGNHWTTWRVMRDSVTGSVEGLGPKTMRAISEAVEPKVLAWIAGPEYAPSRQREIAAYISREALERYGTVKAMRLLEQHKLDISSRDYKRIKDGIDYLDAGIKLLGEGNK